MRACKAHFWGASEESRLIRWLIDEEFCRCVGGDGGGAGAIRSDTGPELIKPDSRASGTGSLALALVDGGRAALEGELLWLVALGNANAPRH